MLNLMTLSLALAGGGASDRAILFVVRISETVEYQ
jgi:hypothetical protein